MTHNAPPEAVIAYTPIGIIHSPFKTPPGTPIQAAGARGIAGTIVLAPAYIPGLQDLEGFSHLLLVYHFHLVQDVIDRVPKLGARAAYAKQAIRDQLLGHKAYIARHGDDMPEITGWKWGQQAGASASVRSTEADNA
jgi:hypothetical protein